MTTQYGTSLQMGATISANSAVTSVALTIPNANNYIIRRATVGKYNVSMTDTEDAVGALANRSVHQRRQMLSLELICKAAADPLGDFEEGTAISLETLGGNATWWVNSCAVEHTKDPWVVTVEVENTGLAVVP